jgi:hypothetical protein
MLESGIATIYRTTQGKRLNQAVRSNNERRRRVFDARFACAEKDVSRWRRYDESIRIKYRFTN